MNEDTLSSFKHIFIDSGAKKTLFLLHGTGGDERDLLPLIQPLQSYYNVVGLKGNVSEQGLTRFFARSALGVFDQASIQQEVTKLAQFLTAWYSQHSLTSNDATFVGYSNGANMILATLFLYPQLINRAVLLHPMVPFSPDKLALTGKSFLVSYGKTDPLIFEAESQKVITTLQNFGATVEVNAHPGGHELVSSEVAALQQFLI